MPVAKKATTLTVKFTKEKETKNAYRFKETVPNGDRGDIGTIYVLKETLDELGINPEKGLTVTVKETVG